MIEQDGCQCNCRDAILEINQKLDKILTSLASMGSRMTDLEVKIFQITSNVSFNSQSISELKDAVQMSDDCCLTLTRLINNRAGANNTDISKLDDRIDDLENRSSRNNIVIHGVPEKSEGNRTCEDIVSDFITSDMKLEGGSEIEVERAHHTPGRWPSSPSNSQRSRPQPIHCMLRRYTDRQLIIKNPAGCLKNNPFKQSKIFISDDVTAKTRGARNRLRQDHLPGIWSDHRVSFAYIPMSLPPIISYKLTSGQFRS